jgi:mannose-6-phosphate isomerase-like protein (cupin superfamily)
MIYGSRTLEDRIRQTPEAVVNWTPEGDVMGYLFLSILRVLAVAWTATTVGLVPVAAQESSDIANHAVNILFSDLKWQKIVPELGERSSEIAILRVDPKTQATQLMIRAPKNFHVPKHWHTANETHTIVSGTFIIECEGKRAELGPGSFNYLPSKMPHEGWTKPNEGALLFITVDAAWDINWVNGPPKPEDFTPKAKQ